MMNIIDYILMFDHGIINIMIFINVFHQLISTCCRVLCINNLMCFNCVITTMEYLEEIKELTEEIKRRDVKDDEVLDKLMMLLSKLSKLEDTLYNTLDNVEKKFTDSKQYKDVDLTLLDIEIKMALHKVLYKHSKDILALSNSILSTHCETEKEK